MKNLLIIISVVAFVLAGCSGDTKVDEKNIVKAAQIGPKAETAEDDFVYRLVSEKSVYAEGERVELYAELEYVGEEQEIKIAHASSPISFPMKEKTRGFEIGYTMSQPRIVTTLKKGEPLREQYKGSGGYGSQDPKEYVDFIKAVAEASRKGSLPSGEYVVAGVAEFEPLSGSTKNEDIRMNVKIEFIVGENKNNE
ncbi:hypothetical protein [Bacillus sp. FJAT-28004]|uniref:hypothetical protein n=1 Tax=Bacillus sp. FJAT-28004 TaxID=1679165 RepID=UPI0006B58E42|nr:hypothetical protein [Bacillus sp. FJAT-28004]